MTADRADFLVMPPTATMILIRHKGQIAAIATASKVTFTGPYNTLPLEDPDRRFVYAMALCAADIITGRLPGPYTDEGAEAYARGFLELEDGAP